MSDSQWPRYEVFIQERANKPHQNAGSVHAPDAEMALLNARDVFVRRPSCLSLWVVPAAVILARSLQELAGTALPDAGNGPAETYYIFRKKSQRNSMTYVTHSGQVEASSPEDALAKALQNFGDGSAYVWWVCPERAIVRSREDDVPSMFAPADGKAYRMPQDYRVAREMMTVKRSRRREETDDE